VKNEAKDYYHKKNFLDLGNKPNRYKTPICKSNSRTKIGSFTNALKTVSAKSEMKLSAHRGKNFAPNHQGNVLYAVNKTYALEGHHHHHRHTTILNFGDTGGVAGSLEKKNSCVRLPL
jgi:hypothetical protein